MYNFFFKFVRNFFFKKLFSDLSEKLLLLFFSNLFVYNFF
jgi:hypothetical protein